MGVVERVRSNELNGGVREHRVRLFFFFFLFKRQFRLTMLRELGFFFGPIVLLSLALLFGIRH